MNYTKVLSTASGEQITVIYAVAANNDLYTIQEMLAGTAPMTNYRLTSINGLEVPILVPEHTSSADRVSCSVSQLLDNLRRNLKALSAMGNDAKLQEAKNKLPMQLQAVANKINHAEFSVDILEGLMQTMESFDAYITKKDLPIINIQMNKYNNIERTQELVNAVNLSGRASTCIIPNNETKRMVRPTDELFIKVADYAQIQLDMVTFPSPMSIASPYGNYGLEGTYIEPTSDKVPKEFILGTPENNELPLQSNEQRYAKALETLVQTVIDDKGEEASKKNLTFYLTQLAYLGCAINWLHVQGIPLNIISLLHLEDDNSDVDSDSESDSADTLVEGRAQYNFQGAQNDFHAGDAIIANVIERIIEKSGWSDAIAFVIKLYRWGVRKPTRIEVYDGKFLDMNTLKIYNSSGSLATAKVLHDENGNNLIPLMYLSLFDMIHDPRYIKKHRIATKSIDIPIGLICIRKYENEEQFTMVALSIFDIVSAYKNNEPLCKIAGLGQDLDFTKIEIKDSAESMKNIITCFSEKIDGTSLIYQTSEYLSKFMSKNALDSSCTSLHLIKEAVESRDLISYEACRYETEQQLNDNIISLALPPQTIIKGNLIASMVPTICAVNDEVDGMVAVGQSPSRADILNMFVKNLVNTAPDIITPVVEQPAINQPASQVTQSTSFTTPTTQSTPSSSKPHEAIDLCKDITKDFTGETIYRLVVPTSIYKVARDRYKASRNMKPELLLEAWESRKDTQTGADLVTVGYMKHDSAKSVKGYYLCNPKKQQVANASASVRNLVNFMLRLNARVQAGSGPSIYFEDEFTIEYFTNLCNQILSAAISMAER